MNVLAPADASAQSARWLFWRDGARNAYDNMAVDEALLHEAKQTNLIILRIYEWERSAVSIGCFQRKSLMPAEGECVRRLTGGGLVEHGADLTYTLAIPKSHPLETHDREHSYAWIHDAVAHALDACGTSSHHASTSPPKSVDRSTMVCFNDPSRYDLLSEDGKRAGAAQRRTAQGVLHQGSVRLGNIPLDQLAAALPHGFRRAFACFFTPFTPTASFEAAAKDLVNERYCSDAWINRR